jgi:hypothetical protein
VAILDLSLDSPLDGVSDVDIDAYNVLQIKDRAVIISTSEIPPPSLQTARN